MSEDPQRRREAYARAAGFASWAERQAAIEAQQERYRLAEQWRKSDEGMAWALQAAHLRAR